VFGHVKVVDAWLDWYYDATDRIEEPADVTEEEKRSAVIFIVTEEYSILNGLYVEDEKNEERIEWIMQPITSAVWDCFQKYFFVQRKKWTARKHIDHEGKQPDE
jgi:hypothetical protein